MGLCLFMNAPSGFPLYLVFLLCFRRLYCSQFHGEDRDDCKSFVNDYAKSAFITLAHHLMASADIVCTDLFQCPTEEPTEEPTEDPTAMDSMD